MTADARIPAGPIGFVEKTRVAAACAVGILLLWTLGWRMAQPVAPAMPVTLTGGGRAVLAVGPGLLVLSVVIAALAAVVAGRRIAQGGVLAAAVGLAVLAARGGSMQMILAYQADTATGPRRAVMTAMLLDTLCWTAILAAAWISAVLVRAWLWPAPAVPAASEPPVKPAKVSKKRETAPTQRRAGWPALAVTTVVALLVVWTTIARTPVANIARGQVFASVVAGLYLGALAARHFTGITAPAWYALAAPLAAIIAYVVGYLSADMAWAQGTPWQPYALLATTPPHDLVRALPIEYLALGVAGAIGGFWTGERWEHAVEREAA